MPSAAHWYVYDGKQVLGPYSVEKLDDVRRETTPSALSKLMISKRGLDQWHPFLAFDEIVGATRDSIDPLLAQKAAFSRSLKDSLASLDQLNRPGSKPAALPVDPLPSFREESYAAQPQAEHGRCMYEPAPRESVQLSDALATLPVKMTYLLVRSRQRLGEHRNSFFAAFIYTAFSVGIYIPIWIRSVYRELNWHLNNDLRLTGLPNILLLCTPGYQAVVFFRLARFLELAEAQIGYQRTRAGLAATLGVIPPFAIFYLQRRFNEYWHRKAQMVLSESSF